MTQLCTPTPMTTSAGAAAHLAATALQVSPEEMMLIFPDLSGSSAASDGTAFAGSMTARLRQRRLDALAHARRNGSRGARPRRVN